MPYFFTSIVFESLPNLKKNTFCFCDTHWVKSSTAFSKREKEWVKLTEKRAREFVHEESWVVIFIESDGCCRPRVTIQSLSKDLFFCSRQFQFVGQAVLYNNVSLQGKYKNGMEKNLFTRWTPNWFSLFFICYFLRSEIKSWIENPAW